MEKARLTDDDIIEIVGLLDEDGIVAILDTRATREEIMEAAAWAAQMSDVMGEERHPVSGNVEKVYLILVGDEESPNDR
ncbi:hypothetical protein GGE65_007653 [Skermanella aerolata]|uniref:hypothetical protein n=1 Tax=Skermanella aerolata TaxID=393310 RepID=UPI003D1B5F4E